MSLSAFQQKAKMHRLNRQLKMADVDGRIQAASALAEIGGAEALRILLDALEQDNTEVVSAVADALGVLKSPTTVLPLLCVRILWFARSPEMAIAKALRAIGQEYPQELINALEHEFSGVREEACRILGEIECRPAIEALLTAVHDPEATVRMCAVASLGQIGDPSAINPLVAALADADWDVRWYAASALHALGDPRGLAFVREGARHADPSVRKAALSVFETLYYGLPHEESSLDLLLNALDDPDAEVRVLALDRLICIGDRSAMPAIQRALNDPDPSVRETAADGLASFQDQTSTDAFLPLLHDESAGVREKAIRALGAIRDPAVIDELLADLSRDPMMHRGALIALANVHAQEVLPHALSMMQHSDYHVRSASIYALGKIGDARVLNPLIRALADQEPLARSSAVSALKELAERSIGKEDLSLAIPALLEVLPALDKSDQLTAIEALGAIGNSIAFDAILPYTKERDFMRRARAILALGKLNDPRAIPYLMDTLADEKTDGIVRANAIEGLGRLHALSVVQLLAFADDTQDHRIRRAAIKALAVTADEQAIHRIQEIAFDESGSNDTWVRMVAAEALARSGEDYPIEPFILMLKSSSSWLRVACATTLAEIRDTGAIDELIAALADENAEVRLAAAEALQKLTQ